MFRYFLIVNFMILHYILHVSTKEIKIKNNSNFYELEKIINENQGDSNELVLYFVDDYYDMSKYPNFDISVVVLSNITFLGNNNGTVFDYKWDKKGPFSIGFYNVSGKIVKFENLIIKNFYPKGQNNKFMTRFSAKNDNFQVVYNNCTFTDNKYSLITVTFPSDEKTQEEPQLTMINCKFYNNSDRIISTYHIHESREPDLYKCSTIKIINCIFINNNYIFLSNLSHFIFENSYFSINNNNINNEYKILYTNSATDKLSIKDSVFENINSSVPLIDATGLTLDIKNSTFTNCTTENGYLFYVKRHIHKNQKITIENSEFSKTCTLFHGDLTKTEISNSIIKNMNIKFSIPAISDSKLSNYSIKDTIFMNLNVTNELFNKESSYTFENIKFKNIISNSKAVLYFLYYNITLNNIEVDNVSCTGDGGESSFMLYDSDESINSRLQINNLYTKNCVLNGSFIKVKGKVNEIDIHNSSFNRIDSYGPTIQCISHKTAFTMTNNNIYNNINRNKLDCGIIQLTNNVNASIENSNFQNNISKSNGGVLYIKNILDMNLDLNSNIFIKNEATNGGAIFISNKLNRDNEGRINFENNVFLKNKAYSFGGAIYTEYDELVSSFTVNNTVANNDADIIGGGIFISNSSKMRLLDMNKWNINNNTVNARINNYFTRPAYIKLNSSIYKNEIKITTGDHLPLNFILYDEYDQPIEDETEYYSTILIKLSLIPITNNDKELIDDVHNKYNLIGNVGTYVNGEINFDNLKIYAHNGTYQLNLLIKNYNYDIKFDEIIYINVSECSKDQITLYNNYDMPYCETPKCSLECLNKENTMCIPPEIKSFVNDIKLNKCVCKEGWSGTKCDEKVFINYSNFKKFILPVISLIIFIVVCYSVFTLFNKDQGIIKDTGLIRILVFSAGTIIFNISNIFMTYNNYSECVINFIFKHIGILLILCVCLLNILLGYKLGFLKERRNYKFLNEDVEDKDIMPEKLPYYSDVKSNISAYNKSRLTIALSIKKNKNESSFLFDQINEDYYRKIKITRILFIELICIFSIFILFVILIPIMHNIRNDKGILKQSHTKDWMFSCSLEQPDLVFNSIELTLFLIIFLFGKATKKYNYIYTYIQYFVYTSFLSLSFGPIINIITYCILGEQRLTKIYIDFSLNTICYFSIFITFSWDKIYYILKKQGNDSTHYFIFERHEFCSKHNSNICGCKINLSKENICNNIDNYIILYKMCSTLH
ncbi:hypothetical protein BCR36DRAFT_413035 [Piromyces finnis]|uniref:EGF-like domain-containing protein n=1 Tax=Piromyces finnis TaxID=1754191 RepID=A0A1Y1V7N3_9FUNG|nr:hypothetical protein BCR36DRAFT_413035 [Piromyces finnis]|eukprot:ORX49040.1 hypothetical protein BCR36DRAFT_413035 [Piromyces finnis]